MRSLDLAQVDLLPFVEFLIDRLVLLAYGFDFQKWTLQLERFDFERSSE